MAADAPAVAVAHRICSAAVQSSVLRSGMAVSFWRLMMRSPTAMRCPRAPVTVGASAPTVSWCRRWLRASAISVVSQTSSASLPAAVSAVVGGQRVGGHGDRIPAVQAVVGAVPADGAAHRRRPTITQGQRRGAFVGVAHAPDLGKVLCPGQIGAELGEHAAAGFDRGELMCVADQDGLGSGCGGGGEQLAQVVGADHGGFIDDHQGVRPEL